MGSLRLSIVRLSFYQFTLSMVFSSENTVSIAGVFHVVELIVLADLFNNA